MKIKTLESSDIGVAFLIEIEGKQSTMRAT